MEISQESKRKREPKRVQIDSPSFPHSKRVKIPSPEKNDVKFEVREHATLVKQEEKYLSRLEEFCKRSEKPEFLSSLPEEITSLIMNKLEWKDLFRLERVSTWFYCYVNTPLPQWNHIDITFFFDHIRKGIAKKDNSKYWKFLKSAIITFSRHAKTALTSFRFYPKRCFGNRNKAPLLDKAIEVMSFHCPNLEEIALSFAIVSEDSLVRLIERCQKLAHFYFKGTSISEKVLKAIGEKGQCRALDISAQGRFDDDKKNSWMRGLPFKEKDFYLFGKSCKETLNTIRLKRTAFEDKKYLTKFFKTCTNLKRVSAGMSIVDDNMIDVLVKNNPQLTHLKILLSKVTDAGLITISKHCNNLIYLDAKFNEGTTSEAIQALTKHGVCKDLQVLSVYLPDIPPEHLISIFECFPKLIRLDLAQSMLDDDTLAKIAKLHPKTLSLNVSETNLSNDGIQHLINFEDLVELSIGLERVTDASTTTIPVACPKLRVLRIRQQSFSEGAIVQLIKEMPHLRELEFISEDNIPKDRIYESIKEFNPHLHIVSNSADSDDEEEDEDDNAPSSDDDADQMMESLQHDAQVAETDQ